VLQDLLRNASTELVAYKTLTVFLSRAVCSRVFDRRLGFPAELGTDMVR
jgi:hypothetical protein